jgi:ATP-dependent helicase/nuclease subunit A
MLSEIEDESKREIISATKINMYEQCPLKYQLTYELGFKPLTALYEKYYLDNEYDSEEKENITMPQLKGVIVHKLLSENIKREEISLKINEQLSQYKDLVSGEMVHQYEKEITNTIMSWMQSKSYSELNSFKNYHNEYEAYCFRYGHYLYGIIDKLIIENDEVIIIDYKTDKVNESQILERAKNYFTQLKYYSFIISQLFPDISTFNLRLIFMEYPDKDISWKLNREEMIGYDSNFSKIIKSINSGPYPQNLTHCNKCMYAIKGELCVKNI